MRARPRHASEIRQGVEGHIYLAGRAAELVAVYFFKKIAGKMLRFDEPGECQPRIDAGGNHIRINLVSVGEDYSLGLAILNDDLRDGSFRADLHSRFTRRVGDRIRNCPGAAASESPRAEGSVDFTHVVMEQYVRRARRANSEKCPDNSRGRHRGFEHVGFEPLIQEINGGHRHELDLVVLVVTRHALEAASDEE